MGDTKKTLDFQGDMPLGDASKYHPDAIVGFASTIDPIKVEAIGTSYEGIGATFGNSLTVLQDMAQRMSEVWYGEEAAVEAERQLALLYVAAQTMQNNAKQIGGAFKQLANGANTGTTVINVDSGYGYSGFNMVYDDPSAPISLSQFKSSMAMNADYFAGHDVAPIIITDSIKTSDGVNVTIDRSTPLNQRGLYAQYMLNKQNNGIFSAWQRIPQTVTLELPPPLNKTDRKSVV